MKLGNQGIQVFQKFKAKYHLYIMSVSYICRNYLSYFTSISENISNEIERYDKPFCFFLYIIEGDDVFKFDYYNSSLFKFNSPPFIPPL